MADFKGFPPGKDNPISLPDIFFREILPAIEIIEELKVLLYIFWRFEQIEGQLLYLWRGDFLVDPVFIRGFGDDSKAAGNALDQGVQAGVARGTLLEGKLLLNRGEESIILLNTARGQAAIRAFEDGSWKPNPTERHSEPQSDRAPVFQLYEENFGPLTPMIAETLKDAEAAYPAAWIEEAMRIAVENNVRRWRYVDAILRNWQEEGKDERQTRGDLEEDRQRYVRGKFSKYIEH